MKRKKSKSKKGSGKRNRSGKRAWVTRTRNEGVKQLINGMISLAPPVYHARQLGEIIEGTVKCMAPEQYLEFKKKLRKLKKELMNFL